MEISLQHRYIIIKVNGSERKSATANNRQISQSLR